jgi:hypothetical protein
MKMENVIRDVIDRLPCVCGNNSYFSIHFEVSRNTIVEVRVRVESQNNDTIKLCISVKEQDMYIIVFSGIEKAVFAECLFCKRVLWGVAPNEYFRERYLTSTTYLKR